MLLFLPDERMQLLRAVFAGVPRSGERLADVGEKKMLGSHLRAVADAWSLGLCSTIAVKPLGPHFFFRSPRIKPSAQDCQNPSRHGEKITPRGCDPVH